MTKNASSTVPVAITESEAGLDMITLPAEFGPLIAELSEVSAARSALEKREKEIKKEIGAVLPLQDATKWPWGHVVGLRVVGLKGVLAKVSARRRTNVSTTALKEKYPEAYEDLKTETAYLVTQTA